MNTRDIGGIPLPGGRLRTAGGMVVRTAALNSRIPAVISDAAGVRAVRAGYREPVRRIHFLDLRSALEIHSAAEFDAVEEFPAEVVVQRIPLTDPAIRRPQPAQRDAEYFARQYLRMIPAAGPVLDALLRAVAAAEGPVVVGCRLGKDRTGLVVLLLLRLLGVDDHANCREFRRTGEDFTARADWVARYAAGRGEPAAQVMRRCVLPPSVPARTLRHLDRHAPGPAALARLLGIDAAVLEQARPRLTEPKGEDT
ncbi:tyrosine-protein phosphatase [Streptomyces monticola]|uniref:Tyrosine-protein phosphatase n=1 Tax=Streptomyces monticola TaxID=2666263 RepID=A0ABW2JFC6_9ACTN